MKSTCRAVVFTAMLLAWPPGFVLAQPAVPIPPAPTEDSFNLPTDSRLTAKLEAAADFIHDEEWDKTARVLQQLLDLDGDRLAVIGGDKHPRTVSARAEAERLLASLPPAGRKAYQEMEGPRAAEMLKDAAKDKDDAKLALIVRRFLNTDAGLDALEALAGLQHDAGRCQLAALSYQRLLERRDAAKASPETLFRAADAFHQIGDAAHADPIGKQLLDRMGDKTLVIGDRKLSRDEVEKELSKPVETSANWPVFGGDASRSAQGEGGMPFLWRSWAEPTGVAMTAGDFGVPLSDLFKKAADKLTAAHQPVLPPQIPVGASVVMRTDGKKRSVVVYRTHSGVAARDLTTGKIIGIAPIEGSLEWMMDGNRQGVLQNQWAPAYLGEQQGAPRPGIFFENTTIGTLSIDGDFAYTVADLAVPKPPIYRSQNFPGQPNQFGWPKEIMDAISRNRLVACNLSADCKSMWDPNVFNPDSKESIPELSGSIFLGPPLPLDGRLFVLAEKEQELRLIGLENVKDEFGRWKPKVDWVLPLGVSHDSKLEDDALRRINAVHLSYSDGVLVCPTNLGYVMGVDLLEHSLLWVYPYRDKTDVTSTLPPGARVLPGGLIVGPNGQQIQPTLPQQGWRDCAPILQDGKVVFTAYDSKSIHCVNLRDGSPVWSKPRQDGDLYLGGVVNGKVIVVGQKVVRAYNLSNGEKPWEAVETGLPTGFGAASDNVYYVPLQGFASGEAPEVCAIDVARGRVIGHARSHVPPDAKEKQRPFGNLVFFGGALISQTTDSIVAYPLLKAKMEEMNAKLAANPADVDGLFDRAALRLESGDVADAVEDLRKVIDAKPPAELLHQAREALYTGLTQILQNDFSKGEKHLQEYDDLCHVPDDAAETLRRRAVMFLLTGRGFQGEGKLKEALDGYAELAGLGDETLLSVPDEPLLRASPSTLARAGIAVLLKNAPMDKRKELEDEIRRALDKAKESKTDDGLRSFIAAFGPETDAGRDARLDLGERLIDKGAEGPEVEVLLIQVARGGDAGQAARAMDALGRLCIKRGLLDDALYYYRILDRDYGAIKVRDGKTGSELYKELQADKRFLPLLEKPDPLK